MEEEEQRLRSGPWADKKFSVRPEREKRQSSFSSSSESRSFLLSSFTDDLVLVKKKPSLSSFVFHYSLLSDLVELRSSSSNGATYSASTREGLVTQTPPGLALLASRHDYFCGSIAPRALSNDLGLTDFALTRRVIHS